jgi:hypothetical protein
MAVWQYDFHLVPKAGVERHYGLIPTTMPLVSVEPGLFWTGIELTQEMRNEISRLLPSGKAWSDQIERWGQEQGTRIDLFVENEDIAEVFVRLDVRDLPQVLLINLMQIAKRHGLLVMLPDGSLFEPSVSRVLAEIRASNAFRFVQDPQKFLEVLARTRTQDEGV